MATSIKMIGIKKRIQPNPKLEAIRNEGLKDPGFEYNIPRLLEKTSNIHAGWLFNEKLLTVLQQLCLFLDGNLESYSRPGWRHFGFALGLNTRIMNVIEWGKIDHNGYTYNVLLAFVQYEDSTLFKVIDVLQNMKRYDVINEIHKCIEALADSITTLPSNGDNSGYDPAYSDFRENEYGRVIIRPPYVPEPPFILQNPEKINSLCFKVNEKPQQKYPQTEEESIQTSEATRQIVCVETNSEVKASPYVSSNTPEVQSKVPRRSDCKVMLTFASDGIKLAEIITSVLRKKRVSNKRIGVLMLKEHLDLVEKNPEMFILGSFPQVDYIIPIITEGYLKAVVDDSPPINVPMCVDCRYVRFIYTLMTKFYVNNGCYNTKTRCIVPDESLHLLNHLMMREPIFESWKKLSDIEDLAEIMLQRCLTTS